MAIARELGFAENDLSDLQLAAALHDIGKIGVPDEVLTRESALTDDEFRLIQQHTVIGERILGPVSGDRPMILEIARSHHERIDGLGYPDGLRGDDIPLCARIVAVADAFDAMTVARPYRKALSVDLAIRELLRVAGSQLDPACVKAFLRVLAREGVTVAAVIMYHDSPLTRSAADTDAGPRRRVRPRRRRAAARAPPALVALPP